MKELLLPALNLAALVALLAFYLRAPIRAFVATRHQTVRDELTKAREALAKAQAKYKEFSEKLASFEAEARMLRQQTTADAQEMRSRITTEARALSERILKDAHVTAQGTMDDLKSRVFSLFGVQVLERAEKLIRDRLTGDDRARIRKEFSRQVEAVQ